MPLRLGGAMLMTLATVATAAAQQPTPLYPPPPPVSPAPILPAPASPAPAAPPATLPQPEPLPPPGAAAPAAPSDQAAAPAPPSRAFCGQDVTYRVADPASVPPTYRPFVGIWSDADWTPSLCAALIVESIRGDGTAAITYAYGPLGSNQRQPGGVLHGTGIVRDGRLQFQNSDGSQFAFTPFYADLQGQLTTPQGQTYQAVFKKTY